MRLRLNWDSGLMNHAISHLIPMVTACSLRVLDPRTAAEAQLRTELRHMKEAEGHVWWCGGNG